ncbi:MAG: [FeFe] hydrogenase H-cluster radical SAM maturase HydG [Spirochaetes bacterium]|nr:[FeFe] hydrogenase H-cluster radical SAM maturase HydG [Spirochaetota bacterium]
MKAFIDERHIDKILKHANPEKYKINEILAKAKELKGLSLEDVAVLSVLPDEMTQDLYATADYIKKQIYGNRIVLFAPLYISNYCSNDCIYCAFRASNTKAKRSFLTMDEIQKEVETLIQQGHKRILLVSGESYPPYKENGLKYILNAIQCIYNSKKDKGEIRRVNVNIAPLTVEEFKELKTAQIGTYQLFQETYHHQTYSKVHPKGKKADYSWRLYAMDRAMQAGIDDVGIGVLFGLYDWRFELLALMQHIEHLEKTFGVGPHTISVPRIEPAVNTPFSQNPPYPVSDSDFLKIIALLRCAVPYTGIILSTRENPNIRRKALELGVSQISAGSKTNPGGYSLNDEVDAQFSIGDHRSLDEVIFDLINMGFIPSFCTACYRLGRTGIDFMDKAKPGLIKQYCTPNGIATFMEYLLDYAQEETRLKGMELIQSMLLQMEKTLSHKTQRLLKLIESGKRDVYC